MSIALTGVRLGGYNRWEHKAGRNLHGTLDELRVYRGMLSGEQIAELSRASR